MLALPQAVVGADLVQENGPERLDFKQELYEQLDELLPADVIIASSSSGLPMSEIQLGAASHPTQRAYCSLCIERREAVGRPPWRWRSNLQLGLQASARKTCARIADDCH
jgi:hypothetical protein